MAVNCLLCYAIVGENWCDFQTTTTTISHRPLKEFLEESLSIKLNDQRLRPTKICFQCWESFNSLDRVLIQANKIKEQLLFNYEKSQVSWQHRESLQNLIKDEFDGNGVETADDADGGETCVDNTPNVDPDDVDIILEPKLEILVSASSSKYKQRQRNVMCNCEKDDSTVCRNCAEAKNAALTGKKNLMCDICGKEYKTPRTLRNHIKEQHSDGQNRVECSVCRKVFPGRSARNRHMAVHTREKKYQCDTCGKQFIHYSSMKAHSFLHNDVRTNKCLVCGLLLRSTSHLGRHMRTHTGEKPYACPTCDQRFAVRYNMMLHYRAVHEGIVKAKKVFTCSICCVSFDKKTKLDQHLSSHKNSAPAAAAGNSPQSDGIQNE